MYYPINYYGYGEKVWFYLVIIGLVLIVWISFVKLTKYFMTMKNKEVLDAKTHVDDILSSSESGKNFLIVSFMVAMAIAFFIIFYFFWE